MTVVPLATQALNLQRPRPGAGLKPQAKPLQPTTKPTTTVKPQAKPLRPTIKATPAPPPARHAHPAPSTPKAKLAVFNDTAVMTTPAAAAAILNARLHQIQNKENIPPAGSPAEAEAPGDLGQRKKIESRRPLGVVAVDSEQEQRAAALEQLRAAYDRELGQPTPTNTNTNNNSTANTAQNNIKSNSNDPGESEGVVDEQVSEETARLESFLGQVDDPDATYIVLETEFAPDDFDTDDEGEGQGDGEVDLDNPPPVHAPAPQSSPVRALPSHSHHSGATAKGWLRQAALKAASTRAPTATAESTAPQPGQVDLARLESLTLTRKRQARLATTSTTTRPAAGVGKNTGLARKRKPVFMR